MTHIFSSLLRYYQAEMTDSKTASAAAAPEAAGLDMTPAMKHVLAYLRSRVTPAGAQFIAKHVELSKHLTNCILYELQRRKLALFILTPATGKEPQWKAVACPDLETSSVETADAKTLSLAHALKAETLKYMSEELSAQIKTIAEATDKRFATMAALEERTAKLLQAVAAQSDRMSYALEIISKRLDALTLASSAAAAFTANPLAAGKCYTLEENGSISAADDL